MKILPVGTELFRAEGQTDMTMVIVAFRNFANEPNNAYRLEYYRLVYYVNQYKN